MKQLIFLSGIHGVGKTTLANKLKKDIKIEYYSVSSLIRKSGENIPEDKKNTKNIYGNQDKWKEELKKLQIADDMTLLLDGHFCLIDERMNIVELPMDILKDTNTSKIIFMKMPPHIIRERLLKRDNKEYSIIRLKEFQDKEEKMAKKISLNMNIPIYIYDEGQSYDSLIKFIKE